MQCKQPSLRNAKAAEIAEEVNGHGYSIWGIVSSLVKLELESVIFRAFAAVIAADASAFHLLLLTHVVGPDIDAVGAQVAVGTELNAVGLDKVIAAAVVIAVRVLAHRDRFNSDLCSSI